MAFQTPPVLESVHGGEHKVLPPVAGIQDRPVRLRIQQRVERANVLEPVRGDVNQPCRNPLYCVAFAEIR